MCHAEGSRPPAPPDASGAIAECRDLRLRSADGTEFLAYRSTPAAPVGPNVVLLPDMRGLHGFYRDLADRLAGTGRVTIAIDYTELQPERIDAGVRAAIDALDGPVVTIGFCVGGAASWRQSALDERVVGAVGFYGRPDEARQFIGRMRAPLLVLAAGQDFLTSPDDVARFDAELAEAGVRHEVVVYPDAPHSFFDGDIPDQADACADAWRHVLSFLDGVRS